jgi:hypothetical protein
MTIRLPALQRDERLRDLAAKGFQPLDHLRRRSADADHVQLFAAVADGRVRVELSAA